MLVIMIIMLYYLQLLYVTIEPSNWSKFRVEKGRIIGVTTIDTFVSFLLLIIWG